MDSEQVRITPIQRVPRYLVLDSTIPMGWIPARKQELGYQPYAIASKTDSPTRDHRKIAEDEENDGKVVGSGRDELPLRPLAPDDKPI